MTSFNLGEVGLLSEILETPGLALICGLCLFSFFFTSTKKLDYSDVGLNYTKIIEEKEWWRCVTSTFSHINILHLAFNLSSLWSSRFLELRLGSIFMLKFTLVLCIVSDVLVLLTYHLLIHRFKIESYRHINALGISCVAFGWMTVIAQITSDDYFNFLGLFNVPINLAPFSSLLLTQVIVPQASFVGHLAGIAAGFLISWHLFDWFSNWLFYCTLVWILIGLIYNLRTTTSHFHWWEQLSPSSSSSVRVENGVIIRPAVESV